MSETVIPPKSSSDTFLAARVINIVLGIWLFISAFIWPHSQAQYTNTWVVGLLFVLFAVTAFAVPWTRYLNTGLSVWLFVSAFVLPQEAMATIWNNALVAIAVFIVSLLPSVAGPVGVPPRRKVAA